MNQPTCSLESNECELVLNSLCLQISNYFLLLGMENYDEAGIEMLC